MGDKKHLKSQLEFYEAITREQLLYINSALMPSTGIFTYPQWLKDILSRYLAWKVKRQHRKIQNRIADIKFIMETINGR